MFQKREMMTNVVTSVKTIRVLNYLRNREEIYKI